jgi:CHAD domain-containing protein
MLAFSARTLKDRLQVFERELNALKQGRDSGTIHDFRVAARRLRTALSVFRFAFLEGSPKRWRSHIRGLSRAWGPVRDLDVEMGFLNALLKQSETSGVKEGLIQAMGQLELRRKTRHKRALKALKHFKNGPTIVELNTALRAVSLRPNSPDRERIFKRARTIQNDIYNCTLCVLP